jgi:hypothetical protein
VEVLRQGVEGVIDLSSPHLKSFKGSGQKKATHKHYVPEVEKVDATGLFLVSWTLGWDDFLF